MNALDAMQKLKEELEEEGAKSVYNLFLIKGILNTVGKLNRKKENSKNKEYINRLNKVKSIIMDYFNNVYDNEITLSKPQDYLNTLKKLKFFSESNTLGLSPLEKAIKNTENYIPEVLKDGFMIKASENILKNLDNNEIKNQMLKNEYADKAVKYLGIKVPDELIEATIKFVYAIGRYY